MSVGAFLGIFALMFVLELPDKTMIAIIVMSTRARSLLIFFGAASAFDRLTIEPVIEDRFDRAVVERADLERAQAGRFNAAGAERSDQAHDAQAGAEALFGVGPLMITATPYLFPFCSGDANRGA